MNIEHSVVGFCLVGRSPPFVEKVSLLSTLKEGLILRERFFGIPAVL